MNKYLKAKIYKITCSENDLVYYGSTIRKLKYRLQQHKSNYKRYLEEKGQYYSSCEIVKYASAAIELVEEISCNTKKELLLKERFYIENNECVNKYIPGRTNKEHNKQYNEKNKDKKREYNKQYHKQNKEKEKEYRKQYYNKEKLKERILCEECNKEILKRGTPAHKKTIIHNNNCVVNINS